MSKEEVGLVCWLSQVYPIWTSEAALVLGEVGPDDISQSGTQNLTLPIILFQSVLYLNDTAITDHAVDNETCDKDNHSSMVFPQQQII